MDEPLKISRQTDLICTIHFSILAPYLDLNEIPRTPALKQFPIADCGDLDRMEALLNKIKFRLHNQETSPQLECWLQDVILSRECDGHLTLICPNVFSKQWLEARYKAPLEGAIREETGEAVRLGFRVEENPPVPERHEDNPSSIPAPTQEAVHDTTGIVAAAKPQKVNGSQRPVPSPLRKDRYSLSNFVIGSSNRFAWSAAKEVCKQNHGHYNPFLLLGSTGLGKTHLGQAIHQDLRKRDPQQRVLYTTAEGYFSEMIQHMKSNTVFSFKDKYRKNCDTLILDDIQFVVGKKALQSDLCHTLDTLLNQDKRIVLMGNLDSGDTDKLHENLRSRIYAGLVVSMERPDYETRVTILHQLCRSAGLSFPEGTMEMLARIVRSHVRDIEGAFRRAVALQALLRHSMDPDTLETHFRDLPGGIRGIPTLEKIGNHVAQYYGLSSEVLSSRSRQTKVLYPRQVAMYLSRKHTPESLESIGKHYNRDHSSVLYAMKSLEKKTARSQRLLRELRFLEERLLDKDS